MATLALVPRRRSLHVELPNQGGFTLNTTPDHYENWLDCDRLMPAQQYRRPLCSEGVRRLAAAILAGVVHDLRLGREDARAWVTDRWRYGVPAIRIGDVAAILRCDVAWLQRILRLRPSFPRAILPYLQPANRMAHRRLGRHV